MPDAVASGESMYDHFSQVASRYRNVRTTDIEPVVYIGESLKHLPETRAADVGCGDGRYDLLFFRYLNNLHLTCVDINESMLEQVSNHLINHGIKDFETIQSDAGDLPLNNDAMDCIFTFNAVHHFDFIRFIESAERSIKQDGRIFIYTRSRTQNAQNIWGQYFPSFLGKETRLYELDEMTQWIESVDSLTLENTRFFEYERYATLEQLIERVRARHYSTFSLYGEKELDEAVKTFEENVRARFRDTNRIEWLDQNVLLVLRPS